MTAQLYPLYLMYRVLSVSIIAYYAWLSGRPTNRHSRNMILAALSKAAHIKTRETYGVERLHAELKASGIEVSLYKVRKLRSQLGSRMTTELCLDALNMAINGHRPKAGLIVHSDRGSQYCSQAYRQHLDKHQLVCSRSRKGNCYDNARIESFWGSLKNELIHQKVYEYREKARAEIVEYIEIFYNRMRRHTKLGNITPAEAFSNYMQNAA